MTEHSRQHHSLRIGSTFDVVLEGNPSTGFDWSVEIAGPESARLLIVIDLGVTEPPADAPSGAQLVGAPVKRCWRVTALGTGTAHLIFTYRRSWESAPPLKSHSMTFEVGR